MFCLDNPTNLLVTEPFQDDWGGGGGLNLLRFWKEIKCASCLRELRYINFIVIINPDGGDSPGDCV